MGSDIESEPELKSLGSMMDGFCRFPQMVSKIKMSVYFPCAYRQKQLSKCYTLVNFQ